MPKTYKYGEPTELINFKVPISKKVEIKNKIKEIIPKLVKGESIESNNNEYEEFRNITKQLLLGESISNENMEWIFKKCQL